MINIPIVLLVIVAIIALWSVWGFFGSNVEQAEYTVVKKMDGYETREYPAHIAAQTTVQGSFDESMNSGFSILAGYIFGGNTKKVNIAMTAPVVAQKPDGAKASESIAMTAPVIAKTEGDSQIISFGMPRSYTLETLPTPNDPRVKIVTVPAKKYAVMRFSWYSSDALIKSTQEKLLSALARDGIETQGSSLYAGYNAPFTPPWMIRNEVLIELKEIMTKKIVLAGGCFWGMEELIRNQPGVVNTTVGYTGGTAENPTYENHEGHAEAVEIEYDPKKTSYKELLDFFFRIHNPTTLNQQGNDIGTSYRSAVFYSNEEEKKEAENFIEIVNASKRWKDPVVTTVEKLQKFYPAEDYHQDYLQKNLEGYTCHSIYFDSYLK
ncbi:peptide-methionine (S)-S-oxide reductase MsrA [Candidatus Peregrinibacteria bacterium]|nr:peptide-methionine (S)-S-oxide reductase MsrA [Candidatus Peregrinibacteria bacterium]